MIYPDGQPIDPYRYIGNELELFKLAHHWRAYWQSRIWQHLSSDVLEVGAGIGNVTLDLAPSSRRWTALEPDAELAGQIGSQDSTLAHVRVVVGELGDIPSDEIFGTILYIDVLEHIERDREELANAARHLRDGGKLIVLVPAMPHVYSALDRAVGHYRRYTRAVLKSYSLDGCILETLEHLDCVGYLASLANRCVLRMNLPNQHQIRLWDDWMVPISQKLDPILGRRVGKSLLAVWSKCG